MPYPHFKTFQRWKECPRCGFDFPVSQLSRDSTGAKVCPECYDPPGRDAEIAKITLSIEELNSHETMEPIL